MFHFGDNEGGIGEEHKKETGAYAVLHLPLFSQVISSSWFIVLFIFLFLCTPVSSGFCWPSGVKVWGFAY